MLWDCLLGPPAYVIISSITLASVSLVGLCRSVPSETWLGASKLVEAAGSLGSELPILASYFENVDVNPMLSGAAANASKSIRSEDGWLPLCGD